jgi:hypothetical protein
MMSPTHNWYEQGGPSAASAVTEVQVRKEGDNPPPYTVSEDIARKGSSTYSSSASSGISYRSGKGKSVSEEPGVPVPDYN